MAPPAAMLLDGADMTGSALAAVLIPPAGTICLAYSDPGGTLGSD